MQVKNDNIIPRSVRAPIAGRHSRRRLSDGPGGIPEPAAGRPLRIAMASVGGDPFDSAAPRLGHVSALSVSIAVPTFTSLPVGIAPPPWPARSLVGDASPPPSNQTTHPSYLLSHSSLRSGPVTRIGDGNRRGTARKGVVRHTDGDGS